MSYMSYMSYMSSTDVKPMMTQQGLGEMGPPSGMETDEKSTSVARSHSTVMAMLSPGMAQMAPSPYTLNQPHNNDHLMQTSAGMTLSMSNMAPTHRNPMSIPAEAYLNRPSMTSSPSVVTSLTSVPMSNSSILMSSAGMMSHHSVIYDASPAPPKAVPVVLEQNYANGEDNERVGSPRVKSEIMTLTPATTVTSN